MLISHQWAGTRHPDPKFEQFLVLQEASGAASGMERPGMGGRGCRGLGLGIINFSGGEKHMKHATHNLWCTLILQFMT